jgi:hypothetical protein
MSADLYLAKRKDDELSIAKRIADAHPNGRRALAAEAGLTRQDFENEIAKRAAPNRRPGESLEQVFTAYATETENGRALFKAAMSAPVGKPPVQAAQDFKPQPIGEASATLEEMAREMARSKNISYERAFTALLTNPTHAKLRERIKQEEQDVTARVRAARWPNNQAEEDSRTRAWSRRDDI